MESYILTLFIKALSILATLTFFQIGIGHTAYQICWVPTMNNMFTPFDNSYLNRSIKRFVCHISMNYITKYMNIYLGALPTCLSTWNLVLTAFTLTRLLFEFGAGIAFAGVTLFVTSVLAAIQRFVAHLRAAPRGHTASNWLGLGLPAGAGQADHLRTRWAWSYQKEIKWFKILTA